MTTRRAESARTRRMVFYAQTGPCRWRVLLEHLEGKALQARSVQPAFVSAPRPRRTPRGRPRERLAA